MAMPLQRFDWTVDMLDALPDDGRKYEIIDGELFVTPSPIDLHQFVVGELYGQLRAYIRQYRVGKLLMSPSDVRRGDRERNRVQPDVYVVRLTDGARPPYPYDLGDLLLAIEVASKRGRRLDYEIKRNLYLAEGVGLYWVVDYAKQNITEFTCDNSAGRIVTDQVSWHPEGAPVPFDVSLPELFAEAFL